MREALLWRKLDRAIEQYPSLKVECDYLIDNSVSSAAIIGNRSCGYTLMLHSGFINSVSKARIALAIAHEMAHVLNHDLEHYEGLREIDGFRNTFNASSYLTLAVAILRDAFPQHANEHSSSSFHPLFLLSRFLFRQVERRADRHAAQDSLALCEAGAEEYSPLNPQNKVKHLFHRWQSLHPSSLSRSREYCAMRDDIFCEEEKRKNLSFENSW